MMMCFKISNQFPIGIIFILLIQGHHLCQNQLPRVLLSLLLFIEMVQHFFMAYLLKLKKLLKQLETLVNLIKCFLLIHGTVLKLIIDCSDSSTFKTGMISDNLLLI